jgi:hypothetical protein
MHALAADVGWTRNRLGCVALKPEDVFTPATPVRDDMFATRRHEHLQDRVEAILGERGRQVVLHGLTGVRKPPSSATSADSVGFPTSESSAVALSTKCFARRSDRSSAGRDRADQAEDGRGRVRRDDLGVLVGEGEGRHSDRDTNDEGPAERRRARSWRPRCRGAFSATRACPRGASSWRSSPSARYLYSGGVSEHEVDLIVARLQGELRRSGAFAEEGGQRGTALGARAQAEQFSHVTLDRPLLYKPGTRGRIRGTLLAPIKLVLRKLIRWYVEPAFAEQRDFNASILGALEQLSERVDTIAEEAARLKPTRRKSP